MARLKLPTVTLCAVTSVNIRATVAAIEACLEQVEFAETLLLTDAEIASGHPEIRVVPVPRITSSASYSRFMLHDLADHVRTAHCLIVQWDGFVLDARQWDAAFLDYDYIGAPWPQFDDGHDVGNGGFSLRSHRLLEACRDPRFRSGMAEDVAISRANRELLEVEHNLHFADRATAERFAYERAAPPGPTFGFHGIFNMIPAVGPERFWELYSGLDDPTTAFADYRLLMRQLGHGRDALPRQMRLTADRLRHLFGDKRRPGSH